MGTRPPACCPCVQSSQCAHDGTYNLAGMVVIPSLSRFFRSNACGTQTEHIFEGVMDIVMCPESRFTFAVPPVCNSAASKLRVMQYAVDEDIS